MASQKCTSVLFLEWLHFSAAAPGPSPPQTAETSDGSTPDPRSVMPMLMLTPMPVHAMAPSRLRRVRVPEVRDERWMLVQAGGSSAALRPATCYYAGYQNMRHCICVTCIYLLRGIGRHPGISSNVVEMSTSKRLLSRPTPKICLQAHGMSLLCYCILDEPDYKI